MVVDFTEGLRLSGVEEFRISRTINAPLARVWKAWTEAEQLKQWFSPKGFDNLGVKLDLRVGGTMHYGLRSPDGMVFYGRFVFHEIAPQKRLVFVLSFADKDGNKARNPWDANWPLDILTTIGFEDLGGRTEVSVRWIPVNATEAEENAFDKGRPDCTAGWSGTFDNLDTHIAEE